MNGQRIGRWKASTTRSQTSSRATSPHFCRSATPTPSPGPNFRRDRRATYLSLNWQLVGRRPIDDLNTAFTPSYHVVDAGARYAHALGGAVATWRLSVNNIGDTHYWSTLGPGNITGTAVGSYTAHLGSPRTVAASMEVAF